MSERDERKEQAEKHNALMKGAFASETQATVQAAVLYEDGFASKLEIASGEAETKTQVTSAFAPEAFYRFGEGHTIIVDPTSFTRPGGAYVDGGAGPEATLCLESNLYQVLSGLKGSFHDVNKKAQSGGLFSSRALLLPDVVFSRSGNIRKADVLAIAEPMRARALENHRSERECDLALADRISTILALAAANDCDTLICGAFGCGRNGYEASQVASLFASWLNEHPGAIGRIVFSAPRASYDAFDALFGQPDTGVVEETPEVVEEEDASWSADDLPEGITFRSF